MVTGARKKQLMLLRNSHSCDLRHNRGNHLLNALSSTRLRHTAMENELPRGPVLEMSVQPQLKQLSCRKKSVDEICFFTLPAAVYSSEIPPGQYFWITSVVITVPGRTF